MNRQAALATMGDVVGLWYVGQSSAADVPIRHADEEVPELLESALRDLDLAY